MEKFSVIRWQIEIYAVFHNSFWLNCSQSQAFAFGWCTSI